MRQPLGLYDGPDVGAARTTEEKIHVHGQNQQQTARHGRRARRRRGRGESGHAAAPAARRNLSALRNANCQERLRKGWSTTHANLGARAARESAASTFWRRI